MTVDTLQQGRALCQALLLGGAILFGLGTVGLYLSEVYSEVKRRPLYVVAEEA